jgi:biotin synthase
MTLASHSNVTVSATPIPDDRPRNWTQDEALALYEAPFNDLLFQAQTVHRQHFDPNKVQLSRLLSIKTGGCPEDCGYCSQSSHHESGLKASRLMEVERVVAEARKARDAGATRYCMGAAWRGPKDRDIDAVVAMVEGVKALGMETCMTLGMLEPAQAARLAEAGLDYYNHNIDTSERYYGQIISTHSFADRLQTLAHVRESGIKVCCGGIVGMGETAIDRVDMLLTLAGASGKRADQHADPDSRHAAGCGRTDRADRIRPHHRAGAHHDAEILCSAFRGAQRHDRRDAGAVLLRRRQLDLRRRHPADGGESRRGS